MTKPENLQIQEVFNATPNVVNETKVRFSNFDSIGYFSMELVSKKIEKLETECNVSLEFKNDKTIEIIDFNIKILRPKLESIFRPNEIRIIEIKDDFIVENPIKFTYKGHGDVFVHVISNEDSELQIKIPPDRKEIIDKFKLDLNSSLKELMPKYPQYITIFESLENDDRLSLDDIESKLEIYDDIFKKDSEFTTYFFECFSSAVLRNYAQLDDYIITPFIEYIRSSPIRTVHLINPIWCVDFSKEPKW